MDRFARFDLEFVEDSQWSFTGPHYEVIIDGERTGTIAGPGTLEDAMFMGFVKPGDWTMLESIYHQELNVMKQLNVDTHDLVAYFKMQFLKGLQNEL